MKTQKNLCTTRQRWLNKPILAHKLQTWLIDNGSLTARLQQRYDDFFVMPVALECVKPMTDEALLLHRPTRQSAFIREVFLLGNGSAVVFAHSVLPKASLRGAWHALGRLDNKPLGATLFANRKVKRTALSYKKLTNNHALYQQAMRHLATKSKVNTSSTLWARRSIFSLNCANMIVTEVFLPKLLFDEDLS